MKPVPDPTDPASPSPAAADGEPPSDGRGIEIPKHLFRTKTRYRLMSFNDPRSEICCGFVRVQSIHKRVFSVSNSGYFGIFLILHGRGTLVTVDGREFKVGQGDAIQFFPESHHVIYQETEDWLEATTSLDFGLIERYLHLNDQDVRQPVLHPGLSHELIQTFESLYESLSLDSRKHLPSLLLELMQLVMTLHQASRSHITPSAEHRLVEQICHLLEDSSHFATSLEDIAASLGIEVRHLRYLFKKHLKDSPGRFRQKRRMTAAAEMLLLGRDSVADIARKLGYSDPFTFSRQFKLFYGMPPTKYPG